MHIIYYNLLIYVITSLNLSERLEKQAHVMLFFRPIQEEKLVVNKYFIKY
jgi:hypothetical protein